MNINGNHYEVLGVLPTADGSVISAAFRALAKKYHPDVSENDKDEAQKLFQRLNEAHETLSDSAKREQYDAENNIHDSFENFGSQETFNFDDEWHYLLKFYPEAGNEYEYLDKISSSLSQMYKIFFLENPQNTKYREVAAAIEYSYFSRYFGNNESIIDLAKHLIEFSNIEAAKKLNEAVLFFGKDTNDKTATRIIQSITDDIEGYNLELILNLFKDFGYVVENVGGNKDFDFSVRNDEGLLFGSAKSLAQLKSLLTRAIAKESA